MKKLSRANKGFILGGIGTPICIMLLWFEVVPILYPVYTFAAVTGMGFFFFGGLGSIFEKVEIDEMEQAYRSQS